MKSIASILVAITLIFSLPFIGYTQINIKDKVQREANSRINNKVDEGIHKAADAVEKELEGEQEQEQERNGGEEENESQGANQKASGQQKVTLQSYSKFDFIPGEKVIFFEDFSQDKVGDFPALWNTNGSAEVVTTNLFPGQWLKPMGSNTDVWNDNPLTLPENYTIEFDVIPQMNDENDLAFLFRLIASEEPKGWDWGAIPGKAGIMFNFSYSIYYDAYFSDERPRLGGFKEGLTFEEGKKYHVSIWVQKTRVRLYVNEAKVFDLPKAVDPLVKYNKIRFDYGGELVTNIRIAIGTADMRSKLLTEGKLVSYGIYFDVNQDKVKPESYATLKEIAQVMTENPTLKIKIVGHTDSDGSDASNLDLSKRRGVAVKNELVKTFGIDGGRIESDGLGETQPVAPNDTPANKALNRRVEFIKL